MMVKNLTADKFAKGCKAEKWAEITKYIGKIMSKKSTENMNLTQSRTPD